MKLSRRGFLFGFGATAITAAVAPIPAARAVGKHPALAMPYTGPKIKPYSYNGPFYYLHKSEWAFFERKGFNMDLCKLIEPIPTSKGDIYVRR